MGNCLIILATDQRLLNCSLNIEVHGWLLPKTRKQLPRIEFYFSIRVKSFGHFNSKYTFKKISGQELKRTKAHLPGRQEERRSLQIKFKWKR